MKILFGTALANALLQIALAQSPVSEPPLTVVKLDPPVYPPIAVAARVFGAVKLLITLSPNGTPQAVEVVSGPEMLKKSAQSSALRSSFRPVDPNTGDRAYQVTYLYELEFQDCDGSIKPLKLAAGNDPNFIRVFARSVALCDPIASRRVRSPRCLYLWRCGVR